MTERADNPRGASGAVPPPVYASPADLPPQPGDALTPDFVLMFEGAEVPFWRPGAPEIIRAIGLRWFILVPAILFVLGYPLALVWMGLRGALSHGWAQLVKVWIFAVGVAITIVIAAIRRGVSTRTEDFCIHCGYSLDGLEDSGRCPECGRRYIKSLCAEFRKDPHFFAHRYHKMRSHPAAIITPGGRAIDDDGTGS